MAYGKFLADGLTRTLVAAKAREMSARTGGYILLQLLFDLSRPGGQADRVLNGPTNDVWIDPGSRTCARSASTTAASTRCRRSTSPAGKSPVSA